MGKKLTISLGVIAIIAVIALVLVVTGILNTSPITSKITQEPYLSISETHGQDLWLRAEIRIYVANNGGASASEVMVNVGSPGGDFQTKSLGYIAEGETKTADFTFTLLRGGNYTFHATATCFEGSSDSTTFTVHVNGL